MMHFLFYSLLAAVAWAGPVKNSPKVSTFASAKYSVQIAEGKYLKIQALANGQVTGEQIYPFGQEMVLSGDDLCDAELMGGKPREIWTRAAYDFGDQIVFLQALRKRKIGEDLPPPPKPKKTGLLAKLSEKLGRGSFEPAPPGFLDMYYPDPDDFIHGVITFGRSKDSDVIDVAELRINAIEDPYQDLRMTAEELRSPWAFVTPPDEVAALRVQGGGVETRPREMRVLHAFRNNPQARIYEPDVLYNVAIQDRYSIPVNRSNMPPRQGPNPLAHLVSPSAGDQPPIDSLYPRRAEPLPDNDPLAPRPGRYTNRINQPPEQRTPGQRRIRERIEQRNPQLNQPLVLPDPLASYMSTQARVPRDLDAPVPPPAPQQEDPTPSPPTEPQGGAPPTTTVPPINNFR